MEEIFTACQKCSNINVVQNFRSGIHNLQTRNVLFPDQEKLLEKVDDG